MATLKEPFALDRSLNTTEQTPRNIADVLAEGLSHITGRTASEVEYDNTDSGLTADNVQDALDEINGKIPTVPSVDIQTAVDEFETYNGGLLSECIIELVPVQSGSGDPSPDNVRPISGHTQVEVENHQKNLCDDSLIVQGDIDNSTGTDTADGSLKHIRSGYCNAESSTQYTVSHNHTIGSGTLKVFEYRSDKSFIRRTNAGAVTSLSYTFTTHSECKYIRIAIYDENGISKDNTWIQLELGSTATDYVPYNGYQVTVNLGGTYYSGVLDVVSGVFTPDTASVDLGSLTWTYQSNYPRFRADAPSGIKFPSSSSIVADAICDIYKTVSMDVTQTSDSSIGIGLTAYPYIYAHDTRYTDANVYKTAMSGVMLVYELDNPTPIQLSPTMVKALVGENHLSAPLDGQEITESKYKQMFTFDDVIAYIQSLS